MKAAWVGTREHGLGRKEPQGAGARWINLEYFPTLALAADTQFGYIYTCSVVTSQGKTRRRELWS